DQLGDTVERLAAELRSGLDPSISVYVTGPAGFSATLISAFSGIDGLLLIVALAAVLVILLLVYRSLLLPVAVLGTSLFALCAALLTVWLLAREGVLLLSGQTQGILFILVIGAATDYSLLLVARFREELRQVEDTWTAVWRAVRGSFEPILASGGTVIAGLLCLLLTDLRSNSTLGPVAAIGIAFAMLAALTFLPAVLYAFGRTAFWPRRPAFDPAYQPAADAKAFWARLAAGIAKRPRAVWLATTAVLALGVLGVGQLKADGVPQSQLIVGGSEALDGQLELSEHFPGGSGSPVYVLVPAEQLQPAADVLLAHPGVARVNVTADTVTGAAGIPPAGSSAGFGPGATAPAPTVGDGQVLLRGPLEDAPDSAEALASVTDLRSELAIAVSGPAYVGGATATAI